MAKTYLNLASLANPFKGNILNKTHFFSALHVFAEVPPHPVSVGLLPNSLGDLNNPVPMLGVSTANLASLPGRGSGRCKHCLGHRSFLGKDCQIRFSEQGRKTGVFTGRL